MSLDRDLGLSDARFLEVRLARAGSHRLRLLEESLIRREQARAFELHVLGSLAGLAGNAIRRVLKRFTRAA